MSLRFIEQWEFHEIAEMRHPRWITDELGIAVS